MIEISNEEITNKMFFIREENSNQPIAVVKVGDLMRFERPQGEQIAWEQGYECGRNEKRPQCEITEEDIQNAIRAGYENGYSMAQAKYQRPQGEWEHWGSPFSDEQVVNSIVCSVCGARFVEIQDEIFNFCPNCGADMRGKEE